MTIREKLCAALLARGHGPKVQAGDFWILAEVNKLGAPTGNKLFLGQSGALRRGKSRTASISLTDSPVYKKLLCEGEAILTPAPKAPLVEFKLMF